MQPLKNELPRSDDVLFVFYDFETTQDTKFSDNATAHSHISLYSAVLLSLRDAGRYRNGL